MMYISTKFAYDQQRQVIQEQIRQNKEATLAAQADKSRLKQLLTSAKEHEARLKEVLDIIAKKDYDDAKNQRVEYQEQLTMKEHVIAQSNGKLNELNQQLRFVTQEYRNKLLAELTQKSKEATALRTEVETIAFSVMPNSRLSLRWTDTSENCWCIP